MISEFSKKRTAGGMEYHSADIDRAIESLAGGPSELAEYKAQCAVLEQEELDKVHREGAGIYT